MKWLGVILALSVAVLSGCYSQLAQPMKYSMPDSQDIEVFEVDTPEPKITEIVIEEQSEDVDEMQQWNEWRARTEAQDKYDAFSEAWNRDNEIGEQELELEYYCNGLFSNSCLNDLKEVCDHNGCRPVTVECDRFRDSDDICIRYDIGIGELDD